MATAIKSKTSAAYQQLAETLGSTPPRALDKLPAADLKHLNEQIQGSMVHHQEAMEAAETSVVNAAPRALRGTVRKLLGVSS